MILSTLRDCPGIPNPTTFANLLAQGEKPNGVIPVLIERWLARESVWAGSALWYHLSDHRENPLLGKPDMKLPSVPGMTRLAWEHPAYVEHLVLKKLKFISRYRWIAEHDHADNAVPPPLVYKFVLTYKCNLRCTFCYEWGEAGWCTNGGSPEHINEELPWPIIEKIFADVGKSRPSFILSGGEPLLYSHFRDLGAALRRNRCVAIMCTNGLLIDRYLDVSAGNPYLTYLISLDGVSEVNDRMRGRDVYRRVTDNIRALKSLKRPPYLGVQFTVRPENVHTMYEFCREMVGLRVDWVLLNLCWFVSKEQAHKYEQFMLEHFGIKPTSQHGFLMPYDIDKDEFVRQYRRIQSEKWPFQISCYLKDPEEIYTFVDRPDIPPRNAFCYKQWLRIDITPEGTVAPCILYPDLIVGDLKRSTVADVWNSAEYQSFRELRREKVLPVCSKCDALYLYDANRKIL
jgi:MoaA/NifB/PqqE/SkfB family radical SAM enzyme